MRVETVTVQVRDGEMVAVELVATDSRGSMEAVLSLGCIQYDSTRSRLSPLVRSATSLKTACKQYVCMSVTTNL